jgi:membrane-bound serine protease (ClpP class)
VIDIDGSIRHLNAATQRAVERAQADRPGADRRLDTPGGLELDALHGATILSSDVPVLVYVAPTGARAASAGVFAMAARRRDGAGHQLGAAIRWRSAAGWTRR